MSVPLDKIIPPGKKRLIRTLAEAGFLTLEDCACRAGELYKLKGIGLKTVMALKEHCFRRSVGWPGESLSVRELSAHFMSRYRLDRKDAEMVARAFFWDNAHPSSLFAPMF